MGFGFPPRSASRSRIPDKQVIDIDGDGSFLMNIQELATAHVEKIAAKAIILNNQHLGMVVQWEDNFYAGNRGHTYLGDPEHRPEIYPDYVRVCNSFGVKCERVMFKKDLRAAIQRMLDAERALRPRRHHALQHARHPVHPRRQNGGGHDLEIKHDGRARHSVRADRSSTSINGGQKTARPDQNLKVNDLRLKPEA